MQRQLPVNLTKQLNLNENKKIKVPGDMRRILIDVGLAGEAPNSGNWLINSNDRFVIGIEPLGYHWSMIENYKTSNSLRPWSDNIPVVQLEEGVVKYQGKNFCEIKNRFMKVHCAIDDVDEPTKKTFYQMDRRYGASGSSSLLKPSDKHPHFVEEEIEVDVMSLETILDHIDWDRFPFIEHIKTDCEGKDFDVVRSIGKHLNKVLFITSEVSEKNFDHWEGSHDQHLFRAFMKGKGFGEAIWRELVAGDPLKPNSKPTPTGPMVEITFVNEKLLEPLQKSGDFFYARLDG